MSLKDIIFIDIETVSQKPELGDNSQAIIDLWKHKHDILIKQDTETSYEASYEDRAGIYAEFGKIICISLGIYDSDNDVFKIKSIYGDDEKQLLQEFLILFPKFHSSQLFCGHNIKEFDIPYISRRLLINGFKIPTLINYQDKKPWEVNLIDTLHLWRFGDYKNYTSLHTLTTIFDIPSPKNDIDGSMVGKVYWRENDIIKIKNYCERDVIALINLYLHLSENDVKMPITIEYVG